MSKKKLNFEEKFNRLEEISNALESSDIILEDVIKLYEEGVNLSKEILDILNDSELKVLELKKELDGTFSKIKIKTD